MTGIICVEPTQITLNNNAFKRCFSCLSMVKKKTKKGIKKKVDEDEGLSLDDAFGDDEGVEYAENKPRKKKKSDESGEDEELEEELDREMDKIERNEGELSVEQGNYEIKASKSVSNLKKGDKIKIDEKEFTVDAHYVLIDHKTTKEMAIEIFDAEEKDYQLRYFDDQVDSTMEFYELKEILYVKKVFRKIEW